MKRLIFAAVCIALISSLSIAAVQSAKTPVVNYPLLSGDEQVDRPVVYPPYPIPATFDNRDLIGDTVRIGTTWYENQHNGTIGRMVVKDEYGYLHFVWTNGLNYGAVDRHVFYNYIDPFGNLGWPNGYPVESSNRSGYPCLDVGFEGRAFPCFHWTNTPGSDFWTAVATDFFPHSGAFITYETPQIPGVPEVIWPRMQMDWNGYIHIVSTENPESGQAGDPQRHYYTRGTYDPVMYSITYDPWEEMTWTMTIAADVATSPVSDRIAFGWTYPLDSNFPSPQFDYSQWDNDIYVLIDEDGMDPDWEQGFNLTNFIPTTWW